MCEFLVLLFPLRIFIINIEKYVHVVALQKLQPFHGQQYASLSLSLSHMWTVEFICELFFREQFTCKPDLTRSFSGCEINSSYECH